MNKIGVYSIVVSDSLSITNRYVSVSTVLMKWYTAAVRVGAFEPWTEKALYYCSREKTKTKAFNFLNYKQNPVVK